MDTVVLERLGLTPTEIKVYLALLQSGPQPAEAITRHCAAHRRNVYDALSRLSQRGLVTSQIRNNIKLFRPEEPAQLVSIAEQLKAELSELVPQLASLQRPAKPGPEIRIFEGREGIRTDMENRLRVGRDMVVLGGAKDFMEIVGENYFRSFLRALGKKGIGRAIIYDSRWRESVASAVHGWPQQIVRYIDPQYLSPTPLSAYGDFAVIYLWSARPVVIQIRDRAIADAIRRYFRLLWKMATP